MHRTVYYTVPFQRCKLLKYSGIASAVNFYKAKEARSNRAGQAKNPRSVLDTWFTFGTDHMVYTFTNHIPNTLGPNGFSRALTL
jgi:hypothetical protein